MKIALISDIHGNFTALQAVFEHLQVQEYDSILSLGDVVGYGPHPNECVSFLRERNIVNILGNHDAGVTGQLGLDFFREPNQSLLVKSQEMLSEENMEWLKKSPLIMEEETWLAVHAHPRNPTHWRYLDSAVECRAILAEWPKNFIFVGHTHVQASVAQRIGVFSVKKGNRYVINPGAVGQPRDGRADAAYGIVDTEEISWTPFRVSYDQDKVLADLKGLGYSTSDVKRLQWVGRSLM